ncbi:MAG: MAPEG family protein, partial [Hyphomicrobiaceae bacterium]|nr:MAPEG family protein [Hyphomicrobiaceae bacterium]
ANCAEYAPIGLLLLGLAESMKGAPLVLHVLGATLLIGRIVHAVGLSQSPHNMPLRVSGMVMTLTMIGISAALCLWLAAPVAFKF